MAAIRHAKNSILTRKRNQIIEALEITPNATEVARKIGGVSSRTVSRIAAAEGIKLMPGSPSGEKSTPRLSPDRRAAIVEALRANPNVSRVTRMFGGVSYPTVHRIAKTEGIDLTLGKPIGWEKRLLLSSDCQTAIVEALTANASVAKEVAKKMGVSPDAVYRFAKAAGIKLGRKRRMT
jgi:transposase